MAVAPESVRQAQRRSSPLSQGSCQEALMATVAEQPAVTVAMFVAAALQGSGLAKSVAPEAAEDQVLAPWREQVLLYQMLLWAWLCCLPPEVERQVQP